MILIDLQKAFDTVDHSIQYSKLSALGMFVSYLSDRSQMTEFQSQSHKGAY